MNDRAWVATRKGLFEFRKSASGWSIADVSFLGEPVSMVLPPTATGRMLAALNLGHFGVKVHASDDGGASWRLADALWQRQRCMGRRYPPPAADLRGALRLRVHSGCSTGTGRVARRQPSRL